MKITDFQYSAKESNVGIDVQAMVKHSPLLILDEPAHGLDDYSASILT